MNLSTHSALDKVEGIFNFSVLVVVRQCDPQLLIQHAGDLSAQAVRCYGCRDLQDED